MLFYLTSICSVCEASFDTVELCIEIWHSLRRTTDWDSSLEICHSSIRRLEQIIPNISVKSSIGIINKNFNERLHSNSAVEFLHEVETVWSQEAHVQNFSPSTASNPGDVVHQSSQILHSEVVSVILPLITQSLQYFAKNQVTGH